MEVIKKHLCDKLSTNPFCTRVCCRSMTFCCCRFRDTLNVWYISRTLTQQATNSFICSAHGFRTVLILLKIEKMLSVVWWKWGKTLRKSMHLWMALDNWQMREILRLCATLGNFLTLTRTSEQFLPPFECLSATRATIKTADEI